MRQFSRTFCVALLVAGLLTAVKPVALHAQAWAEAALEKSPRHGEYITIHEPSGRALQAWVVYPEVKGKAPVVVMIHEIFGLSDWAREMADEVAGAGYIVVEPDLLSGLGPAQAVVSKPVLPQSTKVTLTPCPAALREGGEPSCTVTEAQLEASMVTTHLIGMGCDPMDCSADRGNKTELRPVSMPAGQQATPMDHRPMGPQAGAGAAFMPMQPGGTSAFPNQGAVTRAVSMLPPEQVMADLDAAADYGKKLSAASGKLYVAGFCWGGSNSFLFATHRRDLSAAFVFYGTPPPADAMKNIDAPVYGFYAGNDGRVTTTIPQTETEMKAAGKAYEPVVYDGAGHGFMRLGEAPDATAANTAARQEGFRRLVQLLGGLR